jgi:hypothetical protein
MAVLAVTVPAPAQIGDSKCVDKLNTAAAKVSATQNKKVRGCI